MSVVRFDYAALRRDLRAWLEARHARGITAAHVSNFSGVHRNRLHRFLGGQDIAHVEIVASLAAVIGKPLEDYMKRGRIPRRGVDWDLFRSCASMLDSTPAGLAAKTGIDPVTAKNILAGRMCRPSPFLKVCATLNVDPSKFGQGWRDEWQLNKQGRSAVDRYDRSHQCR